jgi:hypothetical protein
LATNVAVDATNAEQTGEPPLTNPVNIGIGANDAVP